MRSLRGVSLVDVVVGSALFLVIFMALFGILRASIAISGLSKLKAAATSLATSQMEYIRALEYDAVGTQGGIPSGAILQNATTTQAGLTFNVRTYIVYADDPADGSGALDANGITTDYKRVKVTVSYTVESITREVTLLSNIAPQGIETTVGGGTLRVTTVDALGAPVTGATVRVVNNTLSPVVDVTTFSDSAGQVLFGGAPASPDYEVHVSKDGYSSTQTYERDATNVNPTPGHLTVSEGQTTTGTFALDVLSTLGVRTFSPIAPNSFVDTFSDASGIANTSNTTLSGESVVLSGGAGAYAPSGTVLSSVVAPTYLASWTSAEATLSAPALTSAVFHVADATGTLLSDAVLPGNAAGFTGTIDISALATTTYPALSLLATLTSQDVLTTPAVLDWELAYEEGPLPLPNVSFTVTGAKTIGSQTDGTAILKTTIASTTDETGVRTLVLEWDSYTLTFPSYTVVLPSPFEAYEVLPNTTVDAHVILTP